MSFPTSHDPNPATSESLQLFHFQLKTTKKIILALCIHKQGKKWSFTDPWLCLLELWITADIFLTSAHQASQSTERTPKPILINKTTVCDLKCHIKTPSVAFLHLRHTLKSQYFPWHLGTCLSLHHCWPQSALHLVARNFYFKTPHYKTCQSKPAIPGTGWSYSWVGRKCLRVWEGVALIWRNCLFTQLALAVLGQFSDPSAELSQLVSQCCPF